MVKINRDYLDPALNSINDYTNSLHEKSRAQRDAVRAAAQAVADKAKSDLVFRTNISRGVMITLILIGLGLFFALAADPISQAIKGQRAPASSGIFRGGNTSPISGNTQPDAISQSVTLFNSVQYNASNTPFSEVFAGHTFNSVYDEIWSRAYCYAYLRDGEDLIRIDLSEYQDPNSEIVLKDYRSNERFSRNDFIRARQLCPYQTANF